MFVVTFVHRSDEPSPRETETPFWVFEKGKEREAKVYGYLEEFRVNLAEKGGLGREELLHEYKTRVSAFASETDGENAVIQAREAYLGVEGIYTVQSSGTRLRIFPAEPAPVHLLSLENVPHTLARIEPPSHRKRKHDDDEGGDEDDRIFCYVPS
jgi:hypothetical protein